MPEHQLTSLRHSSFWGYLGALGVLRLVTQQADPQASGAWRQGHFVLRTTLEQHQLAHFLQHSYQPTPIASPWNASSGFYPGADNQPRKAIQATTHPRFHAYRQTLDSIDQVVTQLRLTDRPADPAQKLILLKELRQSLPDPTWMDSVVELQDGTPYYRWLYLAGGNDGRLELSLHFMTRVQQLLIDDDNSAARLHAALFQGAHKHHETENCGPYHPAGSGGVNASSDRSLAKPLSNPWSYLLALEGSILAAQLAKSRPYRPVGEGSLAPGESQRHDLAFPLWKGFRATHQLAQEPADLLVSLLPRNGRNHFAIIRGVEPSVTLFSEVEAALEQGGIPCQNFRQAAHRYQQEQSSEALRLALEELGRLPLHHIPGVELPEKVIAQAHDGSAEFSLALALSGLGAPSTSPLLAVRPQLEHFTGRDFEQRLLTLLFHRLRCSQTISKRLSAGGNRRDNDPLSSSHTASPQHVQAFLSRTLDEPRTERLFRALCLVQRRRQPQGTSPAQPTLPFSYALCKLAFLPRTDSSLPLEQVARDLSQGQAQRACSLANAALKQPIEFPPLPSFSPATGRRQAAALLFPLPEFSLEGAAHV